MINKQILKYYNHRLNVVKVSGFCKYTKEVNEAIFSQPYIKPKVIGKVLGRSSRTTLTKLMEELVAAKILTPKKDGSEVYYLNDDLIRILAG